MSSIGVMCHSMDERAFSINLRSTGLRLSFLALMSRSPNVNGMERKDGKQKAEKKAGREDNILLLSC